ncbi:hypothetical protein [Candidatus Symbiothrix dinenymphae]|uniref:hypothetical protein n=1 Tax=Candidatus Symbiothrix dinenymphae TaxID=467085 RepID=UPI001315312B|nr:hypothetical protein [Candidatus Symbiothrix dinenymphae]
MAGIIRAYLMYKGFGRAGKRKISNSRMVSRFFHFQMTADAEIDIGQQILQKLADKKRSIAWLAREIDRDRGNLSKTLKCNSIHSNLLYDISIALEEDFFALYSKKIEETLKNV